MLSSVRPDPASIPDREGVKYVRECFDSEYIRDTSSTARFLRNQRVFYIPKPVPHHITTPKYSTGM